MGDSSQQNKSYWELEAERILEKILDPAFCFTWRLDAEEILAAELAKIYTKGRESYNE